MVAVIVVSCPDVILEIRVIARSLGGDAAGRIVHQHHLQEIESLVVKVVAERSQ